MGYLKWGLKKTQYGVRVEVRCSSGASRAYQMNSRRKILQCWYQEWKLAFEDALEDVLLEPDLLAPALCLLFLVSTSSILCSRSVGPDGRDLEKDVSSS